MRSFLRTRWARACGLCRGAVLVAGLVAVALIQASLLDGWWWVNTTREQHNHGAAGHSEHSHSSTARSANYNSRRIPENNVVGTSSVTAVGEPSRQGHGNEAVKVPRRRDLHSTRDATDGYVRVVQWVVASPAGDARSNGTSEWDVALATHTTGCLQPIAHIPLRCSSSGKRTLFPATQATSVREECPRTPYQSLPLRRG